MRTDELLETMAPLDRDGLTSPASPRLKSKIYSALVNRQSATGRLLPLAECMRGAAGLCVFEAALAALPIRALQEANPCRVCHARLLGERMEHAPIFWPGCPYADFHDH